MEKEFSDRNQLSKTLIPVENERHKKDFDHFCHKAINIDLSISFLWHLTDSFYEKWGLDLFVFNQCNGFFLHNKKMAFGFVKTGNDGVGFVN